MTTTVSISIAGTTTMAGVAATLGLITTLTLLALLIGKEISMGAPGERQIRWSQALNVGVVPLLFVFIVIVAVRLTASL